MAALSASLRDEAIAIAKSNGDSLVEERHVIAALLRKKSVINGFEGDSLPPAASVLGARGSSFAPPTTSEAADALLAECTDVASARAVLLRELEQHPATLTEPLLEPGRVDADERDGSLEIQGEATISRSLEESIEELNQLVGLDSVKETVSSLIEIHRLNGEREARGLPVVPVGLHLVFTGNPGTGKTTVARIVAEIYRGLGLLPRGQLIEVQRADLIAGYVGQTAIQVKDVVKRATGGVLFIDEAYALTGVGDKDFGAEAIATLVKEMEDHRDELAVIVAGYSLEMESFIASNSGLRSRFQRFIDFPNYSDDELIAIFTSYAAEHRIGVPDPVDAAIRRFIAQVPDEVRIGNGRFVRNLFEQMYSRMAVRVAADGVITDEELESFEIDDVPVATQLVSYEGWGFARGTATP